MWYESVTRLRICDLRCVFTKYFVSLGILNAYRMYAAFQVLSVFQERRIISDETARFEELLVRQRDCFVEEELKEKYKRLISFVQQTEASMSSGEAGKLVLGLKISRVYGLSTAI